MWFRVSAGQLFARYALFGFILAAAGCQSGDSASVLGLGADKDKPAEPKVLQSELLAYCPKVTLREGTAVINSYAKGGDGDPAKLIYQASMSDATRSCSRAGGELTMNVAVAGKVVPGPAAPPGEVTLPIRIAVTQGETVLFSKIEQHTVALGDASAAVQFVFNNPQVTIPEPQTQDVLMFAGFDQGPPPKASGKKN